METNLPDSPYLGGKLLIATPAMGDPRFERTVILMCNHDAEQALGLVINRAAGNLRLHELLENIDIGAPNLAPDSRVLMGGPVQTERGFVIHSPEYFEDGASLEITPDITITPTKGILEAMVSDSPPARARMALGYAGWGAGQLDDEILDNAWLVTQPSEALIFAEDLDAVWTQALATLGIKPEMLSSFAGHA